VVAYSASADSTTGFKGLTSKRKRRKEIGGKGTGDGGAEREPERKEGLPPPF